MSAGPARAHPRHPGLPEAGDRLQGHHAAAARPGGAGRARSTLLADWARPRDVDLVVAAEARGFILGAALARELGVGFVPARKPGKLPRETVSAEYILEYGVDALEMHADALADGARVLLHDDLLATGGTARALAELVEGARRADRRAARSWSSWLPRRPRAARGLRRPRADRLRRRVSRGDRPAVADRAGRRSHDVWAVVGDPYHLPRWWPLTERVEGVDAGRRGPRCCAAGARQGRCAPTTASRRTSRRRRRAWSQELEGTPFERLLREHRTEVALAPAGGGTAVTLSGQPARPRDGAARDVHDAPRDPPPARRGARRPRGRRWREREQVFWGWGEPGAGPSLPEHAEAFLREELGLDGRRRRRRRSRSRDVAAARAGAAGRGPPRAGGGGRRRARARRRADARAALPRQVLPRPAGAARRRLRGRAGRRRAPRRTTSRSRRCCAACAEEGVAVVPFGGGTSVVGGLEAPRAGFAALVSLDLGRLDARRVRRRALADRRARAGHPAAGGRRGRCGAHGLALGARAAELRVGDGRRLRRRRARPASPRPATGGSTRTSSRCAARRRPGSWRRSARPAPRPGRRCASSWSAPRARSA